MTTKKAKKAEPEIVINFPQKYYVVGADLSLKRPGFCKLALEQIDGKTRITDMKLLSVDNKTNNVKCHGQLIDEIMEAFIKFIPDPDHDKTECYYVRETEIINKKTPYERNISKVVGMMDWLLWKLNLSWYSIYPSTIKMFVTGNGRANKKDVEQSLPYYVGTINYNNDDESDATAVAIAWLIQRKQLPKFIDKKEKESSENNG